MQTTGDHHLYCLSLTKLGSQRAGRVQGLFNARNDFDIGLGVQLVPPLRKTALGSQLLNIFGVVLVIDKVLDESAFCLLVRCRTAAYLSCTQSRRM